MTQRLLVEMGKNILNFILFLGLSESGCFIDQSHVNPLKLDRRLKISPVSAEAYISDLKSGLSQNNRSMTISSQSSEKTSYSKFGSSSSNRLRRDIKPGMLTKPENSTDARKQEIIHLDCSQHLVQCINFNCRISKIARKSEAFITIYGILGNKTLMDAFPRVDTVKIYSNARVSISSNAGFQMSTSDEFKSVSFF